MKFSFKSFTAGVVMTAVLATGFTAFAESTETVNALLGRVKLMVNGQAMENETLLYGDSTYVPLRALAEMLDMEVAWDGATGTAYLGENSTADLIAPTPEIKVPQVNSITANAVVDGANGITAVGLTLEFAEDAAFTKEDVTLIYHGWKGYSTYYDTAKNENVTIYVDSDERNNTEIKNVTIEGNVAYLEIAGFPSTRDFDLTIGDLALTQKDLTKTVCPEADQFTYETFKNDKVEFNYRLYTPADVTGEKFPIVFTLHGSGESADRNNNDNNAQLVAYRQAVAWADEDFQMDSPCYVVVPQFPSLDLSYASEDYQEAFVQLLDSIVEEKNGDADRIYAATLSMGSRIMYSMLSNYPDYFAAAMLNCGNPNDADLSTITSLPMLLIHAEGDTTVATKFTPSSYGVLSAAGNPNVWMRLYPVKEMAAYGVWSMHSSYTATYADQANLKWMMSFSKAEPVSLEDGENGRIAVNGSTTAIAPAIIDGQVMVPAAAVAEMLNHSVTATGTTLAFSINENDFLLDAAGTLTVNGSDDENGLLVSVKDGIIYVQGDFFSKYADCRLDYIPTNEGVKVSLTQK